MKFQISETIYSADAHRVLLLLEACLREIAADATTSGDELVLHGLGPSRVSINRRDIAVFRIHTEDGKTVVHGDVSFQASSLLGELPQDSVVRSKLEAAFEKLRMELDAVSSGPAALSEEPVSTASTAAAVSEVVGDAEAGEHLHADAVGAVREASERVLEDNGGKAANENTEPAAEPLVDERMDDEVRHTLEPLDSLAFGVPEQTPELREDKPVVWGSRYSKRATVWIAGIALLLLLIGLVLMTLRGRVNDRFSAASTPTASATHGIGSDKPDKKMPSNDRYAVNTRHSSVPKLSGDLNTWIESWADAMRSRDAVAQSSFYANTGDQDRGQQGLSSKAIVVKLESDIRKRKGLWTVKMEDVVLERQTNTEAEIRLVKHVIEEPHPPGILESFVPAHLVLERVDGAWKIFSEQDSPASLLIP